MKEKLLASSIAVAMALGIASVSAKAEPVSALTSFKPDSSLVLKADDADDHGRGWWWRHHRWDDDDWDSRRRWWWWRHHRFDNDDDDYRYSRHDRDYR